jgi:heme/copper-type cytochrome/quinol oxidase subunit 2
VSNHFNPLGSRRAFGHLLASLASWALVRRPAFAGTQARRDFTVVARRYAFSVDGRDTTEIRVMQNDLVHITFSTEDIPHSFTIEEYRIMRRAEPGRPVSFSFRADMPGRFRFYCNLTADARCREAQGTLIVEAGR